MLMTPETFVGCDQPGAALAGDGTKPAARKPAMVRQRKERVAWIPKRRIYFADARGAPPGMGQPGLEPGTDGL